MINSYNITPQAVVTDEALTFNANKIKTGCTITHASGTASFSLDKSGFYFITFNGDASAETAGTLSVQLFGNDTAILGASSAVTAAVDTTYTLSFSTLVQVLPSCCACNNDMTLTVVNTGVDATYSNANIVITKLC